MKIKWTHALTLLFSAFFIENVRASCGYELNVPNFNYSVDEVNPSTPSTLSLTRTKDEGKPCLNYFLTFSEGDANNYNRRATNLFNGDVISYNLYKNANGTGVLKEKDDINSSSEVIYGEINRYETKTITYYFKLAEINSANPPRSGFYYDHVQVRAYSGFYNGSNSHEDNGDLTVMISVPKFISLSLVDTGAAHDGTKTSKTLDFGELEQAETLGFDVRVVSNAGYILKISSSNNGVLNRVGGTGDRSKVSYDFYASNSKKSLVSSASSPVTIASYVGRTPAGGTQVPIRVTIGSVEDKDPGSYQDYLTLSVVSND